MRSASKIVIPSHVFPKNGYGGKTHDQAKLTLNQKNQITQKIKQNSHPRCSPVLRVGVKTQPLFFQMFHEITQQDELSLLHK